MRKLYGPKSGRLFGGVIVATLLGSGAIAPAATIPYQEDFNDGVADNFTVTTNGGSASYNVVSNAYQAQVSSSSAASIGTSAIQLSNAAGSDFSISTDFSIASFTSSTGSTLNCGLSILSSTADLGAAGNTSQYRILYTIAASTNAGKVNIQEGSNTVATSATAITPTLSVPYHLQVDVTYAGATPTITATVTQGANTPISTSFTDSTPQGGSFFGYRTALNTGGGTINETVNYDNFSATVPEPTAVGLVGFGLIGLLGRRRRAGH